MTRSKREAPIGRATWASKSTVDVDDLRDKVRSMYGRVADHPDGDFHFEMGRDLASRLGYPARDLDRVPPEAVRSFAGVGYTFDLAALRRGERVLDLGSGSGMDSFLAAEAVGPEGRVLGVDMTAEQLSKAESLRERHGYENVSFTKGYMEELPLDDDGFDVVISNGVVNLAADKAGVFQEIRRVLTPSGRLAVADIVTEKQLSDDIVCDSSLWAACIGGAAQEDDYRTMLEAAGFSVATVRENAQYRFTSKSALGATKTYGVKSISLLAHTGKGERGGANA